MIKDLEKYTIKATIKTPIHISSGQEYDRMNYFIDKNKLVIVKQTWLEELAQKDENLFKDILKSIEEGDFKKLEELKRQYYKDYFDDKFKIEEITIENEALKSLKNDEEKNNQGIIKRHFEDKFTNKAMIPGSTLKGLFRSVYFFDKYDYKKSYYEELKELYLSNKFKELQKKQKELEDKFYNIFSNLYFEDIEIKNQKKSIQKIMGVNNGKEEGIFQVIEAVEKGEFDIDITAFFKDKEHNIDFNKEEFKEYIKSYSNILITREEQILENIGKKTDFIDELNNLHKDGKYPIKIGMFKKSLSYKIYWEEIINGIYKELFDYLESCKKEYLYFRNTSLKNYNLRNFGINEKKLEDFAKRVSKNTLKINKLIEELGLEYDEKIKEKLKKEISKLKEQINIPKQIGLWLGVGDKSIYLDEDGQPMGWIILEF